MEKIDKMKPEQVSIKDIMRKAYEKKLLIPAFNVAYIPMILPIVETLKELQTFGLVEVARPDVEKFGAESFKKVAEEYFKIADRRFTRLHLDHIPVIDEDGKKVDWMPLIKEALGIGYDSVMIDGSRLPLEENIRVTKEVVELAHSNNVPVEAELGAVLGHESGPLPPYEELFSTGKGFTRVDEARHFVKETNVDWLSVAIGNIHGAISGVAKDRKKIEARLNIEHLKKIKEATNIPLVLHGGSGIKRIYLLEAIKNGITKINIGTNIRQKYEKTLSQTGDLEKARRAVAEEIKYLITQEYQIQDSQGMLFSQ